MGKIKFTDKTIKSLKPESKVITYYDKERQHGQGSLGVRVSPKGKKVFFLMYKSDKLKGYTLGVYPNMTLSKARLAALAIINDINAGKDPKEIKKQEAAEAKKRQQEMRVTDLWDAYQRLLDQQAKKKSKKTLKEEKRKWEVNVKPVLGDLRVKEVTPVIIVALLDPIASKHPPFANRLFSFLKILFAVAVQKGWIDIHPMQWLKKPGGAEVPRKKILADEEIKSLWPHFTNEGVVGNILKMILYTAQRPGEVMSMRWDEIENDTWIQETTKTGAPNVVPLSDAVLVLLDICKQGNTTPFVFPSPHAGKHIKYIHKARGRIHRKSKVGGWTAHDLRRTARTLMSRLSIQQHIRERVLNHSQGGVAGVYDQYDYLQEKSDALGKLSKEIHRIVKAEDFVDKKSV